MKNLLVFCVFFVSSVYAIATESFVDSHDPKPYFFPGDGYSSDTYRLVRGSHVPFDAQLPNERTLQLMIIDEDLDIDFILFGLRVDILTTLAEIGASLDYCGFEITDDSGRGGMSSASMTWNINRCANEGTDGIIIGLIINYSIGAREGIIRVTLAHLTSPKFINISYLEYEKK